MWIIKWNTIAMFNIFFNIAINHTAIEFILFGHKQGKL